MNHPLKISEPFNFDNYVIYIHDACNDYVGYLMCPNKEDILELSKVLMEYTEREAEKEDEKYNSL